jgi:hypothetical protein
MNCNIKKIKNNNTPKRYMSSLMQFDINNIVNHIMPFSVTPLPLCIRRHILELSGHIRVGTRSYMYVFYPT